MDAQHTSTDADFDRMSWHDNHVYAVGIRTGADGCGELTLDLDFIIEWLTGTDGQFQFLVSPATLTFRGVTDLKITPTRWTTPA